MLAAGGTGGHLFPAFALAQELGRRQIIVDLVTDLRGDRYGTGFPGRRIHQVPSATLAGRSPGNIARTAMTLSKGVAAAYALLGEVRPQAVIGFGGYPTFPPLLAARMRAIPTALHEQNAVLGRANKMLARSVSAIATSFESTKYLEGQAAMKAHFTGNPVRDVVIECAAKSYAAPRAGEPFQLVVFGGSQGARYFSDTVPVALAMLPDNVRASMSVVQQCREEDLARVRAAYGQAGIDADLAAFFPDLPQLMASAHLIIGRAGASTVSELTVLGRPSILVPLPHSLDNDQLQNATRLAESGGAWCIEQKNLPPKQLSEYILGLYHAPDHLAAAAAAAKLQGRPDAVARLADLVEELMENGG